MDRGDEKEGSSADVGWTTTTRGGGRFYFIFLFNFYFSLSVCVGCSNNGVIKSKELDCLSRKQSSCSLFKG